MESKSSKEGFGKYNEETLYQNSSESSGEWVDACYNNVIHSEHHHNRHHHHHHRRVISSASENDFASSTLRERFQQTRNLGSDGNLKKACNNYNQGAGSWWPNSNPDAGLEPKGCGLFAQMQHKLSNNIGNFGSKIYGLSSNIFSRDHGNQYKPRHNIGNDDFEVIERHELVRLRLLTGNSCTNVAPTTLVRGHRFVPANLKEPNWCDKCGGFIWGISKYCYICINCRFTCHLKCRESVTLDCLVAAENNSLIGEETDETSFDDENYEPENDDESGYFTCRSTASRSSGRSGCDEISLVLPRDRLKKRIEEFNRNNHGLQMTLNTLEDRHAFQGSIRVHMNLIRPITMSISPSPPSVYTALTHDTENDTVRSNATQVMSFYLPRNTSKVIHISSTTTAQEVIRALLGKFNITDNPRKFVLYEKNIGSRKTGVMRKMAEDELPLAVCLSWSDGGIDQLDNNVFVLQENDCGEILWEAFSLPELESFLGVLNREEEEHVEQVREKFRVFRIQLQNELKQKEQSKESVSTDRRQPVFV